MLRPGHWFIAADPIIAVLLRVGRRIDFWIVTHDGLLDLFS